MSEFYISKSGSALMTIRTPRVKSRSSVRSLHTSPKGSYPVLERAEVKTAPKPTTYSDQSEIMNRHSIQPQRVYTENKKVLRKDYSYMYFIGSESLLNMNVDDLDINELKKVLSDLIFKQREMFKSLISRCEILGNVIRTTEESELFTERDAKTLISLVHQMAETAANTSEVEIEYGVKSRELERRNLEFSVLKSKHESLQKRSSQSENELKDLKEKIKNLIEENARQSKLTMTERQRFSRIFYLEITSKIQSLEEGLWAMSTTTNSSGIDISGKLKGAINALLRESQDYRKEIQDM